MARTLYQVTQANDKRLTSRRQVIKAGEADLISFSKINPHDTPVGINFANISASISTVLNKSEQRIISFIEKELPAQ